MNAETPARRVTAAGQAVADYLDALLDPGTDGTVIPDVRPPEPDWRERSSEFEVRLVTAGGLRLAVPSAEISAVLPAAGSDAEVAGPIVDTASVVLPPAQRQRPAAQAAPAYLLRLGEAGAMSCHELGETVRLAPEDVTWRAGDGERPWLAGTVMAHRAALLDPRAVLAVAGEDSSSGAPDR